MVRGEPEGRALPERSTPFQRAKTFKEFSEVGRAGKPAYFCYSDEACAKLGMAYNAHAVLDPRGLAPTGWRVPSMEEYVAMANSLGGQDAAGPSCGALPVGPSGRRQRRTPAGSTLSPPSLSISTKKEWAKETPVFARFWTSTRSEWREGYHMQWYLRAYKSEDEVGTGNQEQRLGLFVRVVRESIPAPSGAVTRLGRCDTPSPAA